MASQHMTWVHCISSIMGVTLNIGVLVVSYKRIKTSQNNSDRFITSLACADMMFCLGMMITSIIKITDWNAPYQILLLYWNISQGVSFSSSLLHILAISMDRLVAVVYPMKYRNNYLRPKFLSLTIVMFWLTSVFIASTQYWLPIFVIDIVVSIIIFIAFISATIIYYIIGRTLMKRSAKVRMNASQMRKQERSNNQTIILCTLLTSTFFICNIPFVCANLYYAIKNTNWSRPTANAVYLLMTFNCIADALFYSFATKMINFVKRRKKQSSMMLTSEDNTRKMILEKIILEETC